MKWEKGVMFKKMPPLAMIQGITVEYRKGLQYPSQLVTKSMYAGMCRDRQKIQEGVFYFYMDFETRPIGLHIYPPPDKQIIVKVRYLPKVCEI
jgi:hypothetical protein